MREVPATVAHDPTLPSVTIDGITFHAEGHGHPDAPTVIVVHGGPGGDYRNLEVLARLADRYHVVFYDQRGTGLSPRVPAEELTLESSLADLHRIVVHYGAGEPVALIGHSWGGMLGAYYLARHPDHVARAVLAEPGVLTTEELRAFAAQMQPERGWRTLTTVAGAWLESTHVAGPDPHAASDYLVQRVMEAPEGNPLSAYWCGGVPPAAATEVWRVGSTAMQAILGSAAGEDGLLHLPLLDASRYTGEVLLIASACNTVIGVERQKAHTALFPVARLAVISHAGHLMFTDQPEASLKVIRGYLGAGPWPFSAGASGGTAAASTTGAVEATAPR